MEPEREPPGERRRVQPDDKDLHLVEPARADVVPGNIRIRAKELFRIAVQVNAGKQRPDEQDGEDAADDNFTLHVFKLPHPRRHAIYRLLIIHHEQVQMREHLAGTMPLNWLRKRGAAFMLLQRDQPFGARG